MADEPPQPELTTTRAVHLILIAVIGLAFVGFFVGIRQGTPVPEFEPRERIIPEEFADAVPAMSYREFDRRRVGPNRDWHSTLPDIEQPEVDLFEEPHRTEQARRYVLAARAQRRAFDGAPPVVPHPIDQMSSKSCMACHAEGTYIGRMTRATVMSHEYMPNCTQCHVEMSSPDLDAYLLAENTFDGLDAPLGGHRAWHGAPPTIPHTVFMRENCMACHGPTGPDPIRTSHPWQTNCMQCHAPSAILDQVVQRDEPSLLAELLGRP